MRILRMIDNMYDHVWVVRTKDGIEWMDEDEVILALAKPHTDTIEVKVIYESDNEGSISRANFDMVYNDKGTTDEMNHAFDSLFNLACYL